MKKKRTKIRKWLRVIGWSLRIASLPFGALVVAVNFSEPLVQIAVIIAFCAFVLFTPVEAAVNRFWNFTRAMSSKWGMG